MATLHLMVGLPCSGKSTRAKILENEYNALVLSIDKYHIKLFGNDTMDENHDTRHMAIEEILWEIAERALTLGIDVIMDIGFWGREERMVHKNRAKELGAGFKIHFMDVPKEELYKRLEKRNNESSPDSFYIPKELLDEYIPKFQPPGKEELE